MMNAAAKTCGLIISETLRRHAFFEQPLPLAENERVNPEAKLIDEPGGDQRLQQFAAAPDVEVGAGGGLQAAERVRGIVADGM